MDVSMRALQSFYLFLRRLVAAVEATESRNCMYCRVRVYVHLDLLVRLQATQRTEKAGRHRRQLIYGLGEGAAFSV